MRNDTPLRVVRVEKNMSEPDWKCAGCGKPSPGRVEICGCPTQVVTAGNKSAWKRPPGAQEASERCHKLIGRLYEMPAPGWMDAKDVDLIKVALKSYAESLDR